MRTPSWWPLNLWPFCLHRSWSFVRNIFGDEIRAAGMNRSWFRCDHCGIQRLRPYLAGENFGNGDGFTYHPYSVPAGKEDG